MIRGTRITVELVLRKLAAGAKAAILVAQVAPMSGPIGVEGVEYNSGIKLALTAANANGGVLGQKVVLETVDDEYSPDKTVAAIRRVGRGDAVALLMHVGSPSLTKVLAERVLDETGLPVIGVVPGAEPFRRPHNPLLFHIRAGDLDQYQKIVEHSLTIGMRRIAVVYVDIPFGKAGLAAVEAVREARDAYALVITDYNMPGLSGLGVAEHLAAAAPGLPVLITSGYVTEELIARARALGVRGVMLKEHSLERMAVLVREALAG